MWFDLIWFDSWFKPFLIWFEEEKFWGWFDLIWFENPMIWFDLIRNSVIWFEPPSGDNPNDQSCVSKSMDKQSHKLDFSLFSSVWQSRRVLVGPATSGSVEHLFSTAGYLNNALRNRLSPQALNQQLFISRNISLIWLSSRHYNLPPQFMGFRR
jgi:hypothetical protein